MARVFCLLKVPQGTGFYDGIALAERGFHRQFCTLTFLLNFSAWGNLANILNGKGKAQEAEDAYKNALRHRANMADVHYNL